MSTISRWYARLMSTLGIALVLSGLYFAFQGGSETGTFAFLALAVPAAWIRMRFEPSGHITLAPVLVFTATLFLRPLDPIIIATFSALISARVFARKPWLDSFAEVGIEGIPTVLLVWVFSEAGGPQFLDLSSKVLAFLPGLLAFVFARVLLIALWAHALDGVGIKSFIAGPGRQILINLPIFGAESVALAFLATSFSHLGFLAPVLAVASLIEFYYPYKLLSDQEDATYASLAMIAQAIDAKDPYTATHSRNVASIAVRIARVMGLDESEVRRIRIGSLLHDIGKVGVPGSIIRKPLALEKHEDATMRQHPVISAEIMRPVQFLKEASEIVQHHHEHFDGSGYPNGLRGEEIPLGSRVILVADAFDAMTSDRPYRKGRSKEEAIRVLQEHAGRQFDEAVVHALKSVVSSF